jgi:hypothetical protein
MENPVNPMENPGPLDDPDPMDDSLLNALEHNTLYPTGFMDPLAKYDHMFMDDMGRQLQNLEAGIDGSLPVFDMPDIGKNGLSVQSGNAGILEPSLPPGDFKPSETVNNLQNVSQNPTPSIPRYSSDEAIFSRNQLPPKSRRRGGGCGRKKQGFPFRKSIAKQGGRTSVGMSSNLRYCFESHELIDKGTCESCGKYRHWPQGTNEEPRACWYDWQPTWSHNKEETEDDNE